MLKQLLMVIIVTEKFKKFQWKGGTAFNGRTIVDFKNKNMTLKLHSKEEIGFKRLKN